MSERDAILRLALAARQEHEKRHPLDAEPAAQTEAKVLGFLDDPKAFCLTQADSQGASSGFLLARLVIAPPVYAPGGPVCLSLFGVLPEGDPTLLRRAAEEARNHGAVLLVVDCSQGYQNKEALLRGEGFTVASEWYRGALPLSLSEPPDVSAVRTATTEDVPAILAIGEKKRMEYEGYQPVFWKKADTPKEEFGPFITGKVTNPANVVLVHSGPGGSVDGYVFAENGYLDDYAVAEPGLWPTVGAALLTEAARRSHEKGVARFLVVCGNQDVPKRSLLAGFGFDLVGNWYTLPL